MELQSVISHSVLSAFRPRDHDHDQCMASALERAAKLCAARNARLTPLRRRVLKMIWAQHEPVLAYDLLAQLRLEGGRAAPPTIYRALAFLADHGLVHRIESLNAYVGCGAPESKHSGQFLICERCHSVAELADRDITAMLSSKARDIGFHVGRQTIELGGLCPDCRERAHGANTST